MAAPRYNIIRDANDADQIPGRNPIRFVVLERDLTRAQANARYKALNTPESPVYKSKA
jgi:hypothetical protein